MIINTSGTSRTGNIFLLQSGSSSFLTVGESADITLVAQTNIPVNVVGGSLTFTPDIISIESIDRSNSVVDIWSEEPLISAPTGIVQFSGGIISEDAAEKLNGKIFSTKLKMQRVGMGTVTLKNPELLANNGEGTNVVSGYSLIKFYVRAVGTPSPDINNDGALSIADVNSLYLKAFRAYNPAYDLNLDGKVSAADIRILISLF